MTQLYHEIRMIDTVDAFMALRSDWVALTAAAKEYSQCWTYDYSELAASVVLDDGGTIAVVMVYDDHDLRAIWPLAIERKGLLRIAKNLTCGNDEEYGGPFVRDATCQAIVTAAITAARQVPADVLQVRWVPRGSILQESLESAPQSWLLPLLGRKLLVAHPGYLIHFRGFPRWDEYAATLSKHHRRNLRRYSLKRLSEKGRAEFGWCKTVDDADAVLAWLFAKKRHWAEARGFTTQYLMNDRVRDFFMAYARRIDLSTTPLVAFVKVNDVPVAAALNLVGLRSFEYFITTYDEGYANYSVGSLITYCLVHWSHANDRDFDFRFVYTDYKARWANHEIVVQTHLLFLSLRGRLAEISLLAGLVLRIWRRLGTTARQGLAAAKARMAKSSR
jgi:CelD/BcsL family acetyltransferase involved in cellulose biosynthesis